MKWKTKPTISSLKTEIVDDSVARKKLVEKLIELVRIDEREKVLSITDRARQRAEDR